MTLQSWRPFRELGLFNDGMNRFFRDSYELDKKKSDVTPTWYPATDIYETEDGYLFKLEVAGLSKDDIDIEYKNELLVIKGERKENKEIKREDYHRVEMINGKFNRTFRLPQDVDPGKIEASMKNGVLELKIAKAEEKKPKSIDVKIK